MLLHVFKELYTYVQCKALKRLVSAGRVLCLTSELRVGAVFRHSINISNICSVSSVSLSRANFRNAAWAVHCIHECLLGGRGWSQARIEHKFISKLSALHLENLPSPWKTASSLGKVPPWKTASLKNFIIRRKTPLPSENCLTFWKTGSRLRKLALFSENSRSSNN